MFLKSLVLAALLVLTSPTNDCERGGRDCFPGRRQGGGGRVALSLVVLVFI